MADSGNEYTGKSVEEAVAEGLNKLGLNRNQVDIEILNRGSRGIFGLGSEPARIRMVPRAIGSDQPAESPAEPAPVQTPSQPPVAPAASATAAPQTTGPRTARIADLEEDEEEEAERGEAVQGVAVTDDELSVMAVDMLNELVELMGFDAQVQPSWQEPDDPDGDRYLLLEIHGQDVSPLIGRRGETLASIQYLVRLMVNQRLRQWKNIVVDVEHYKERRIAQLTQLALRMADQVSESGRAVSLEPMPANERRIVHLALRDHPSVYTQSSGEGDRRKVHIVAKV
jgi:spoIIIJ-associated protein